MYTFIILKVNFRIKIQTFLISKELHTKVNKAQKAKETKHIVTLKIGKRKI